MASVVERLTLALGAAPPLRLAVVFGSIARGCARPDSDVDVAILPRDPSMTLAVELDLQAELSRAAGCAVDLVRLDHASTTLRFQIARDGLPLYAETPSELSRFRARAGIEHAELNVVRTRAEERFRRRLAGVAG